MKHYDFTEAVARQKQYCREKGLPYFAPRSGRCPRCDQNIYAPCEHGGSVSGIDTETAGRELITCCPHCHTTFID